MELAVSESAPERKHLPSSGESSIPSQRGGEVRAQPAWGAESQHTARRGGHRGLGTDSIMGMPTVHCCRTSGIVPW